MGFQWAKVGSRYLRLPLGYHSDFHGWRWGESLLARFCVSIIILQKVAAKVNKVAAN